jgi:hypothetical protein
MSIYPELDSIEIQKLKKRISELEIELSKAQAILKENDLIENVSQVSDEELICVNEIHKLRIASDNGILTLEDVKILDILVKNLLAIRGKPVEEKKDSKKGKKSVAELLSIVDSKK